VQLGLRAGIECFEHGTFLDESTIKDVQVHGAVIVATLSCLEPYQDPQIREALRPELVEWARDAFPAMARVVKMANDAGVTVGLGSDQSGPAQCNRAHELAVRARITNPLEAIHAATAGNASILRLSGQVGCLREGLAADLIAIDGDPTTNPEILEEPAYVRLVVRSGKLHKNTLPEPLKTEVARAFASNSG
jgi:imidazolonepropionase-like amidohydrolase